MPIVKCNKGHHYNSSIYDICPFCPTQGTGTEVDDNGKTFHDDTGPFPAIDRGEGDTDFSTTNPPGEGNTFVGGRTRAGGRTVRMEGEADSASRSAVSRGENANLTLIPGAVGRKRKLVGLLVSYDTAPEGQSFPVYEGKNHIGRAAGQDIRIPADANVSGNHLLILYRSQDGFRFFDRQSSNGTFVNDVPANEGALANFDIIRVGATRLLFIEIPQKLILQDNGSDA
ncbi:MAG: FHA domain-containing protein [Tannerella sp.]|jgi:hypothetical protein|nr:FHA domain-containing protein [Tannerella sp.]